MVVDVITEGITMSIDKIITAFISIGITVTIALILLMSAPWGNAPPVAPYYATVAVFWLLLILRILLAQWQKNNAVTYKSYIGPDNKVKKMLIIPSRKEIAEAAAGLLEQHYVIVLVLLVLLFMLNHLLLFAPNYMAGRLPWLYSTEGASRFSRENILLAACLASVLALAAAVLAQTREIKQNNKTYSVQNLIVNAHSRVDLDDLHIRLDDSDQMFLSLNKQEYILQAKEIPSLRQPKSQTLLQITLSLKLGADIPVTEFYIKRLSLFVADTVIECENIPQKFHPLFAINNNYTLDFYIFCKEVVARLLAEKFYAVPRLRLYFCFVMKNSVGVITELYGTALYDKENSTENSLYYSVQETRANQYYYI
jgi:hypothetical protein